MKKVFKKLFLIFILFNLFGTTNLMAKKEQYHPLLILEDIQVSYPKKTAVLAEVYYGFLNYIKYTGEKPKLIPIDGDSFYISEKKIYIPTKAFDEIPPESLYYFIGGAFEKDPEGFLERQGKNISRIKPREADFKKDQTEEKNKILNKVDTIGIENIEKNTKEALEIPVENKKEIKLENIKMILEKKGKMFNK